MRDLGWKVSHLDITRMVAAADADDDGHVDFYEFVDVMIGASEINSVWQETVEAAEVVIATSAVWTGQWPIKGIWRR